MSMMYCIVKINRLKYFWGGGVKVAHFKHKNHIKNDEIEEIKKKFCILLFCVVKALLWHSDAK